MASGTISEPQETYTLAQFISLRDADKIVYQRYAVMERSITYPTMVYAIDNVRVTLDEKMKYQYKPKLLAYDIYGSTESYFMILALNGMCNLKEFSLEDRKFYALTPADLSTFMSSIYNAESKFLQMNRVNLEIYES